MPLRFLGQVGLRKKKTHMHRSSETGLSVINKYIWWDFFKIFKKNFCCKSKLVFRNPIGYRHVTLLNQHRNKLEDYKFSKLIDELNAYEHTPDSIFPNVVGKYFNNILKIAYLYIKSVNIYIVIIININI